MYDEYEQLYRAEQDRAEDLEWEIGNLEARISVLEDEKQTLLSYLSKIYAIAEKHKDIDN